MEAEAIGVAHDPYAALRYRGAQLYLSGFILEAFGSQIQTIALMWELYQRQSSAAVLGWVAGVQAIPMLLLTLPAGYLADVLNRRAMVFISQLGQVLSSVWLAWLSWHDGSVGMMLTAIGLGATFQAFGSPALSSMLPSIVPMNVFSNAATWKSSGHQVASVSGPAAGAFVLAYAGGPWAYIIAGLFSAIFAINILFVKLRPFDRGVREPMLRSLAEGMRFVFRTKIILATITLDMFAVMLGGVVYVLPIFAKDRLDVGEYGFGFLRAAPAVGAFVTAMIIAHTPPFKNAGRAMLLAVAGFGLATVVFGISQNYWLSLAMLVLTGAFDNVSVVVRHTLVQVMTPDSMRGRVSAVNNVFIGSSNEIGGFRAGMMAEWIGPVRSVVLGGIGTVLVVGAIAAKWPQVRKFGSLTDAKRQG